MLTEPAREAVDIEGKPTSGELCVRASREQRRLWFLAAKNPDEASYNMAYRLDFKGPLDTVRIEQAIAMLQRRHETLRTRFVFDGDEPLQVIENNAPPAFEHISAPGQTTLQRVESANQLATEFAKERIPLDQAPLFHCRLIRIDEDHHALVFVMHHIVGDGWSHSVLTRDFCAAYEMLEAGNTGPLTSLSLQFADFAEFQNSSDSIDQVNFWIDQVAGLPPIDLPIKKPSLRREAAHHVGWRAEANDTRLLKDFVRSRRVLLSAVLLTAYTRTLGLMSGQNDFFLGTVVANRTNPDVAEMIGFFANTVLLPARSILDRPANVQLEDNQLLMLELQENQEAPLDEVIDGLHLDRNEHEDAPIQALFVLQNAPYEEVRISNVTIELERLRVGEAKVPVTLFVTEGVESVDFEIEYDPVRVSQVFAKDLLTLFREELSVLTGTSVESEEPGRRIVSGRLTPKNIEQTVIRLIWDSAGANPDAIALSQCQTELTYRELTTQADSFASALLARGLFPQSIIATCLPRGISLFVSLIGIMRAGMIWAPIDPDAPLSYRAGIFATLNPSLIIGDDDAGAGFDFCSFEDLGMNRYRDAPPTFPSPDQAAYAISTSGTSGMPKTVLVGHGGLANICLWIVGTLDLVAHDVGIWKTTMVFDAVCRELFPILIAGGHLAVAPRDAERDMELLVQHVINHGATTLHCVPTQLRSIVDIGPLPATLKAVMSGGEPLPTDLAHRVIAQAGIDLYNVYGPTEATVDVTSHLVTGAEVGTYVPIGKPVDNVQLALTCGERLLPFTARGEITVAGCAVAKGYVGHDQGGFGHVAQLGRSYKTGDFGTFDSSDILHCEGRMDRQIKVNGVRIEPGTIEAALRSHPLVGDAQTIVLEDERSEFVALVFPSDGANEQIEQGDGGATADEWQPVFEDSYADLDWSVEPQDNTIGWIDSGNRMPIPPNEVLAATDDAASKILRLKPKSVLELGSGVGTLAFRLIPNVDRFVGIDFAATATEYCRDHAKRLKLDNARFETGDIELAIFDSEQKFDAVILNSVVQYLADEAALNSLLTRIMSVLNEGGFIFLGDVRDARLRDLHAVWKIRRRKGANTSCEDILLAALGEILADEELLVHPNSLAQWAQANGFAPPLIERNCAQGDNELVNFRFSATLCRPVTVEIFNIPFSQREIPNIPVSREAALLESAVKARPNQPISRCISQLSDSSAIAHFPDPRSLKSAEALVLVTNDPCTLEVYSFDRPVDLAMCAAAFGFCSVSQTDTEYMLPNPGRIDPARWRRFRAAAGTIHRYLGERIPRQMVPQRIVALPYCPKLPNGKKNLGALKRASANALPSKRLEYPEPDSLEDVVAQVFQSLLGIPFALDDDFFAMGGNSLIATRARNRLERELSVKLPLRSLFEAATPRLLAREIATMRQTTDEGPRKRADGAIPVISHAQRRLWFIEKLGNSGAVYNIAHAVSLSGELDLSALDRSVGKLCKRHVTLRSTFIEQDGEPQLRIMPPRSVGNIELIETCSSRDQAISLLDCEQNKRFDLEKGPLLRVLAVPVGPQETILCLICHHIVSDGWSMSIALNELAALYEAEFTGDEVVLPELEIDYLDLALHDEQADQRRKFADQIQYWQNELAGAPSKTDLPVDRILSKRSSWAGDIWSFHLDQSVTKRIASLAQEERTTPFVILLSAFHLVLRAFSQQADTVIGTVLANRNRYESEGLVGFLVNPLPLRIKSDDCDSFRSLCERTREVSLRGFDNQDVPFDILVEHLPSSRAGNSEAFFPVMFALQNNVAAHLRLGDMEATRLNLPPIGAMFELSLELRPRPDGYHALFEYSTELFDLETIKLIATLFENTLQKCLTSPDSLLQELDLLPDTERQRLLDFGRGEPLVPDLEDTICHRLLSIATTDPNRLCLIDGEDRLTFSDVLDQVQALAGRLRSAGCGDEDAVGISVSRGPSVVVAMLAVQWAGCVPCYVDPGYPDERKRQLFQIADCKIRIIENDDGLAVVGEQYSKDMKALFLPTPLCGAQHHAFLAFTSGTTGSPKVVQVSHRAVCARLRANDIALGKLKQDDIFAHCYSFNYDGGLVCAFWPLTRGTPITFVPLPYLGDHTALTDFCRVAGVTVIDAIPLVIATLIQQPANLPDLRLVTTGGDASPPDLHLRLRQTLPNADFANQYGPCEGVFNATTAFYPRHGAPTEKVTIGKPIAGCDIAIASQKGTLVPIGAFGEIWISDPYLADGYLNDHEANTAKFVQADFFGVTQRFLRTGDRARWLNNGDIEFAGRIDRQIQLNGMRVEPDEIEAVLRKLPQVNEASVVISDEQHGRVLSAFVVPANHPDDAGRTTTALEWEEAFDSLYKESRSDEQILLDFTGWTRTTDGEPIPEPEMRAWLSDTLAILSSQQPKRVLEVGCGLGLIALSMAPSCEAYLATDISANAVNALKAKAEANGISLRAEKASAKETAERYRAERYDLIILNSVAQYLSGFAELKELVTDLSRLLSPNGSIFVGDVRDLRKAEVFYQSVERHRNPELSSEDLEERVRRARLHDEEAHFDAGAFNIISEHAGLQKPVVRVKPLSINNEMLNFRYDVLLRGGDGQSTGDDYQALNWNVCEWAALSQLLEKSDKPVLIENVPFFDDICPHAKSADLQRMLSVAGSRGWYCALFPSELDPKFCYFSMAKDADDPVLFHAFQGQDANYDRLSNYPGFSDRVRLLRPVIQHSLETALPAHMVPAVLVFVDELPTKPGGKIDEARLRKLLFIDRTQSVEGSDEDIMLAAMADVWREVLNVDFLPTNADFFAFGGHSLLATKLVAKIYQEFGVRLPVVRVFELRTLRNITGALFDGNVATERSDLMTGRVDTSALDALTANHNQFQAWNRLIDRKTAHFGTAFELRDPVNFQQISKATTLLCETHPVLLWRFDESGTLTDQPPDRPIACLNDLTCIGDAHTQLHVPLKCGDGVFAVDAFGMGDMVREIAVRARSDFFDGASLQQMFSVILANIGHSSELRASPVRYPSRQEWRESAGNTQPLPCRAQLDRFAALDPKGEVITEFQFDRKEIASLERLGHLWGATTPALLMGVLAAQMESIDPVLQIDCATDGRLRNGDPEYFPLGPHSQELRFRFVKAELEDVRSYAESAADQLISALKRSDTDAPERDPVPAHAAFSYRFASKEHGKFHHIVQASHSVASNWHPIKLSCFRGSDGLRVSLRATDRVASGLDIEVAIRSLLL